MLGNIRLRVALVAVVWLATGVIVSLWLVGSQRPELTLAAGAADSETFRLASAMADELNEADSSLRVRTFETGGSVENLQLLASGQVDLAMTQSGVAGRCTFVPRCLPPRRAI